MTLKKILQQYKLYREQIAQTSDRSSVVSSKEQDLITSVYRKTTEQ